MVENNGRHAIYSRIQEDIYQRIMQEKPHGTSLAVFMDKLLFLGLHYQKDISFCLDFFESIASYAQKKVNPEDMPEWERIDEWSESDAPQLLQSRASTASKEETDETSSD